MVLSLTLAGVLALLVVAASEGPAAEPLDPARVAEIAQMLPEKPVGLGRPISDRAAWASKGKPARAEEYLKQPLPDVPDELFLEFSRTGNRTHWQDAEFKRRGRLPLLVFGECVENQGRFLPAIEQLIGALCAEKTWVMPAHDSKLTNFRGESIDIDLASSALAWQLATTDWLLGEKLSPQTRALLRENVQRRVIGPYRDMVTGKRPVNWWMMTTSNWNAVCLAGVTGASLALVESKQERAEVVAAAEVYSRNFLKGFTPDGYCSEGLGYWDYGFGHFVLMSETIRQATGGKLDLLLQPQAKAPALFAARIMAHPAAAPAFADCSVNALPAADTMFYLNRHLQLGLPAWDEISDSALGGTLAQLAIFCFPDPAWLKPPAPATQGMALRDWFSDAGVLVARPAGNPQDKLAVALKGGHNAEHHNHNDLGSYTVFLNGRPVLLDPGGEVYTARTFSSRRYESKLLSSFGHPVPVVAGKLQRPGAEARAEIIATDFTDKQDTLRMSLKLGYEAPEVKALERTFVFSRDGSGSLTVTDRVEYAAPQTFESALIVRSGWQRLPDGRVMAYDLDQAVQVEVSATGGELEIVPEQIHEDAQVHPIRLGLRLKQPVSAATIQAVIKPYDPASTGGGLLKNGDFGLGAFAWEIPASDLAALSTERAASGTTSLKITDASATLGSNVHSAFIAAKPETGYVLTGKVWHVSGSGIGMYVKTYDAAGNQLNPTDARGGIAPVGTLSGAAGQWESFRFPFKTPPGTVRMRVWIHSYSASQVEAYLDDLGVEKG